MPERLPPSHDEIAQQLLREKKPFKIDEYAKDLDVGVELVRAVIEQLRDEGYTFTQIEDFWLRSKNKLNGHKNLATAFDNGRFLHFGIVSDTHLGSKKERVDAVEAMYDIFEAEGITQVFHAGDITEGVGVYRGQEFEIHKHGQDEQIEYARAKYPRRKGITTHFITGNHDLRAYERGGVDVGVPIARQRHDFSYLGQATATVELSNGGVALELMHPDGGVAYALSYKAQKDINNRNPRDLPHILVYGHYHTSFYMHYRGIDFIQAPAFKDAGIWEKRKGLNPTIGGWIVDATLTDDHEQVQSFKPDLFTFDNLQR